MTTLNNGFNSIQESSMEMTLAGLRQDKYIQLFNKKGVVAFDTFVNMTEEDLLYVGITDDEDRKKIMDGIEPLKGLYKDVKEIGPPNLDMVIGNNVHHLRTHLGTLIILRRQLMKKRPKNTLIDSSHSSVSALTTLLEILKTQLDYIEDDLTVAKVDVNKNVRGRRKLLYFGLFASSFTLAAFGVLKYFGLTPLEKLKYIKLPHFIVYKF